MNWPSAPSDWDRWLERGRRRGFRDPAHQRNLGFGHRDAGDRRSSGCSVTSASFPAHDLGRDSRGNRETMRRGHTANMNREKNWITCACCGYKTVVDEYDGCSICDWCFYRPQECGPDIPGFGNGSLTLRKAQQNFMMCGNCAGTPKVQCGRRRRFRPPRLSDFERDPEWHSSLRSGGIPSKMQRPGGGRSCPRSCLAPVAATRRIWRQAMSAASVAIISTVVQALAMQTRDTRRQIAGCRCASANKTFSSTGRTRRKSHTSGPSPDRAMSGGCTGRCSRLVGRSGSGNSPSRTWRRQEETVSGVLSAQPQPFLADFVSLQPV